MADSFNIKTKYKLMNDRKKHNLLIPSHALKHSPSLFYHSRYRKCIK